MKLSSIYLFYDKYRFFYCEHCKAFSSWASLLCVCVMLRLYVVRSTGTQVSD